MGSGTGQGWRCVQERDGEGPSYVEFCTPRAIDEKIGYTLANPTAAELVRFSNEWPGVRARVGDIGERTITVERPRAFFAEDGTMPAEVELSLELPEVLLEIYGVKQARSRIAEAGEAREAEAHATAAAKAWAFKGADRVRKGSPYSRAKTLEDWRRLNPRYAGEAEAIEAAIARRIVPREVRDRARAVAGGEARRRVARGRLRHEAVAPGPLRAAGLSGAEDVVRAEPRRARARSGASARRPGVPRCSAGGRREPLRAHERTQRRADTARSQSGADDDAAITA